MALLSRPILSCRAGALGLGGFALGFFAAAYAGFGIGVPDGMHWLACIPLACLVAVNTILAGCAGWLAFRFVAPVAARIALALPALWMAQEWLLSLGPLAFPWARLGAAQAPSGPLAGLLPIGGTLLASAAMLALAALVVLAWRRRISRPVAATLIAAVLAIGGGGQLVEWTSPTTPLRADLLQMGITASERTLPGADAAALRRTLLAARSGDGQLLVTSQLALPKVAGALPPGYLDEVAAAMAARHGDALVGMYFEAPERAELFNGVQSVGESGAQRYLKYQLFPFGEFLPLRGSLLALVQRSLPAPQRDTARPARRGGPLWLGGHRAAVAVCYEAAFADAWREQAATADILVNVSSDGSVPTRQLARQFLQVDQARAIELGKPLLRTSDIQGTYALDEHGRIVSALPAGAAGVLPAVVTGRSGLTPFARFGDTLPLAAALLALSAALLLSMQAARPVRAKPASAVFPATRRAAQAGQVLPLSICLLLVSAAMFYLMVNAGQSVTEKIRVTNAADAAAYSAGVVEARALNYNAYLNRAMIANEIVIAQMVSYGSWVEYFATASDNWEASATDVNFFVLPNPKVYILDTIFGGTEFATHYYGETAQEYADYIVDYGIGPIITLHDGIILALSASQIAVQANLTAGLGQGLVASDVVKAMDPKLKAEVVMVTEVLPSGFDRFTKEYTGSDRSRFKDVTMRSRDPFSKERNWTLTGGDIPLLRKGGALKKRGGTDIIGLDEWRGIDTLEQHGSRWGIGPNCGRFLPAWCKDIKEPVGWGALEIDAGGGDAGHGYHGNAYGENAEAAKKADQNMHTPEYYHFSGLPATRDVRDVDPKDVPTTGITILVTKMQADTLTSGNAAVAGGTGDLAMFADHPASGKLMALSRATVYFDRVSKRADGKQEIGSVYNPYWRVHLTAPLEADRIYAATQQGGLILPTTP